MTIRALILCLGGFWTFGMAQVVTIPGQVEVHKDVLSLGDIAKISSGRHSLGDVQLGYAPYAGAYRWLGRGDLNSYLRRSGVDPDSLTIRMPDRVLITREAQRVTGDAIRSAIELFLRVDAPRLDFSIEDIELPSDILLPKGDAEIRVDHSGPLTNLQSMTLKLDFYVQGERQRSQWARVKATARVKVAVVSHNLGYGTKLRPSDLAVEERTIDRVQDFFFDPAEAIGTVAKRNLQAGEILTQRDVQAPTLVKPGDVVSLLSRGRFFSVSTLGRSRDEGKLGEQVQVENLDSRQVVTGVVTGEKEVEVKTPEGIR